MQFDGKFAIGLFDLKLSCRGGHAEGVVVGSFDNHDGDAENVDEGRRGLEIKVVRDVGRRVVRRQATDSPPWKFAPPHPVSHTRRHQSSRIRPSQPTTRRRLRPATVAAVDILPLRRVMARGSGRSAM